MAKVTEEPAKRGWGYHDHLEDLEASIALLHAGADPANERRALKAALGDVYILSEALTKNEGVGAYYRSAAKDPLVNGLRQVRGVVVHNLAAAIDYQRREVIAMGYGMGAYGVGPYGGAISTWVWARSIPAKEFYGEQHQDYDEHLAGQSVLSTLDSAAGHLRAMAVATPQE